MTTEHHNLLDWLEDSIPSLPSFLDDNYDFADCDWWADQSPDPNSDHLFHLPPAGSTVASPLGPANSPAEPSKKRRRKPAATEETEGNNSSDSEVRRKPPVTGRKATGKLSGGSSGNNSKEVRWAEQLLNPLAAAIEANNLSRAQHLLYVLQELASPTGDANHRLAFHGLHALTRHLSPPCPGGDRNPSPLTFAATEPKLFRSALIKFHEVSPWFAFPNSLANSSILQTLNVDSHIQRRRYLHIIDIGVSHGIQWPTLLEALTRRSSGVPSLVRLTIAGDAIPPGPFSSPPAGYDFPSHLLRYSKSIDLNLKIDRVVDLSPLSLSIDQDEILVICAQFRAHHCDSEQRTAFLRSVRELEPDLVILTEIDGGDGTAAAGFAKRAEVLWRFLDSTSAAFKGRDCAERRVMEGEMARFLGMQGEGVGEGREKWRERMIGLGFREEGFGEEAVDGGRALLRKYDGNWEMKAGSEMAGVIGLWWKGQPVSFCSIWKPVMK